MILDTIDNLKAYESVSPLFGLVASFIATHPLDTLPAGRTDISGDDLYVNIVDAQPRTAQEAILESHIRMADIQIPISGSETHAHTLLSALPAGKDYDAGDDIAFYPHLPAERSFQVLPGQFVAYLPLDAHAPAITPVTLRKAIFKVKI